RVLFRSSARRAGSASNVRHLCKKPSASAYNASTQVRGDRWRRLERNVVDMPRSGPVFSEPFRCRNGITEWITPEPSQDLLVAGCGQHLQMVPAVLADSERQHPSRGIQPGNVHPPLRTAIQRRSLHVSARADLLNDQMVMVAG